MIGVLVAAALAGEPSDQTLAFYNARLALREGAPRDAITWWYVRNALEDHTGLVSPHDTDFGSIAWAALGDLGICQDGLSADADGAGIWPIALYDWVVHNQGRRPMIGQRPFKSFGVGRQARRVGIHDVLSIDELSSLTLTSGPCLRPRWMLFELGEKPTKRLSDPVANTRLLGHLLDLASASLNDDVVVGRGAVEARRFDVHLQLLSLAAQEARAEAQRDAGKGRAVGMSSSSVAALTEGAPSHALTVGSVPAQILDGCRSWSVDEWMTLSSERRVFLFDQARAWTADPALEAVALGVIDALARRGEGVWIDDWIARAGGTPSAVWSGDRGAALLALDPESGFHERAAIALPRGVDALAQGDLEGALRSFATALAWSAEATEGEVTHQLALRWLSHTIARFETSPELLALLEQIVPARDFTTLIEDLAWKAALRSDSASFARALAASRTRGQASALDRRLALLHPLARGDGAAFARGIEGALVASPAETLRLLDRMVARLSLDDPEVRDRHVGTLLAVRARLEPLAGADDRQGRVVGALLDRILGMVGQAETIGDRARAFDPDAEVFVGAIRLAPSDPLPWPFVVVPVGAPSVFEPLVLTPREWRVDGRWVFGWSVEG